MTHATIPDSCCDGRRQNEHYLVFLLALVLLISSCMISAAQNSNRDSKGGTAKFTFEKYEVVLDSAKRQTVLTGSLFGGSISDLAVVKVDDIDIRHLIIYSFGDGRWSREPEMLLRPDTLFVDIANIGGQDRLITYEPGRLNWFDLDSETEHELVMVSSSFKPPRKGEVPHVDITQDLNGDSRDDLVVPDSDGFWVCIQMSDGTFADAVKINASTDMSRIYGSDGYRYAPWSQSRVHEIDYDQDGQNDLVFWNENHFEVHIQDERGLFTADAKVFNTDVAFESSDLSSFETGDMTGRVLHSLSDMNGDGIGDLVVYSLEGTSISKKRSTYEVYYGKPTPDEGTIFASKVGATFQSKNKIQLVMDRQDFDDDGHLDVMITTIETRFLSSSLWKKWKGYFGDDIWLDLEFYRNKKGRYPDKPTITHRIQLDGTPSPSEPGWVPLDIVLRGAMHESRKIQESWPRAFNRTLLIGDVTGDGRSDLLIEHTFRGLRFFSGVEVTVILPNDEEYTWQVDLNKDAKQDILMHHPFTLRDAHGGRLKPPGTEPHRVTLLIAH